MPPAQTTAAMVAAAPHIEVIPSLISAAHPAEFEYVSHHETSLVMFQHTQDIS
jgi:hypothetical protein